MPAQRIAMRRIREVLRLKHECDLSYGRIAQALRISKATVANYLVLAEAVGVTHRVALGLDDAALTQRLAGPSKATRMSTSLSFPAVSRAVEPSRARCVTP